MSKLVIVESPHKATMIKKYLGKSYDVTASVGHITVSYTHLTLPTKLEV